MAKKNNKNVKTDFTISGKYNAAIRFNKANIITIELDSTDPGAATAVITLINELENTNISKTVNFSENEENEG